MLTCSACVELVFDLEGPGVSARKRCCCRCDQHTLRTLHSNISVGITRTMAEWLYSESASFSRCAWWHSRFRSRWFEHPLRKMHIHFAGFEIVCCLAEASPRLIATLQPNICIRRLTNLVIAIKPYLDVREVRWKQLDPVTREFQPLRSLLW